MSIESTKDAMMRYWQSGHSDLSMFSEDVEFTVMGTGDEYRGPEAVMGMLQYFYHIAFQADVETTNTLIGDGQAVTEGIFVGKHIGEFAGIPATGKDVRVPLCVVYDLENDQIQRGRIYFETDMLRTQLGV